MKFGRYLAVMALSWVLGAATVVGFNLVVDAIGISPIRIAIAGFNERKPFRQDHDWIVKRYDVARNHPTTVFMGSSRIKQTIDPRLLAGTGFAPAYNGAINGSAAVVEIRAYLQSYLRADKNLRHVFIEVFAPSLLTDRKTGLGARAALPNGPRPRPPMVQFGAASDIADFASVFFSMSGASSAIRTIAENRTRQNLPLARSPDDGFAPIALAPHHFSVRNAYNFMLHTGFMQRGHFVASATIAEASRMIADCRTYQVDCRFFVSPLHADVLFTAHHFGLWPELETLKRTLARFAPTYDFTRYSHLIDERIGPVVYWPELFHFSPALGELMAKAMTDLRTPDMPENFGAILDSQNVDASLIAWREERDSWIAQHPDAAERIRKAEDNLRKGLSFKAVTDAEMALGGW
jgi:hypothetical protein